MEERNEVEAMDAKYQEVLDWEAQFAEEIEALKADDNIAIVVDGKLIKSYHRIHAAIKYCEKLALNGQRVRLFGLQGGRTQMVRVNDRVELVKQPVTAGVMYKWN